jgi:hypothetical protein
MIMETIIGLKDKVSKDVSNLRVNSTVINNQNKIVKLKMAIL